MLIAQLSDLHLRVPGRPLAGRLETLALAEAAIATVLALRPAPDRVVITGDLADDARPEQLALLHPLLARLAMPVHLIPGNHDDRGAMRALLPAAMVPSTPDGFVQGAVDAGPLRLVLLDSLVPGRPEGALDRPRLDWLAAELATGTDRKRLLFVHHPPFPTGIKGVDSVRLLEGAEALAGMLRDRGDVLGVGCGHVHRGVTSTFAGHPAWIAPSTAHQLALDLGAGSPPAFTAEPPCFLLHHWTEAGGLVTHQVPIGPWPGPFPFPFPAAAVAAVTPR